MKFRILVFALALAVTGGCASLPRIAPLPAQVEAADQNVKAVTGNLQQLLTMAAGVVDSVSKIEDAASKGGVVPAAADAKFDAAMLAYVDASSKASNALVSGGLNTWPQLRAIVEPVLARGQQLIDTAGQIGAIKSKVTAFLQQLASVLSAAAGEFLGRVA